VPGIDLDVYVEELLARFANPRIGYRLEQIASGTEHKVRQRLLPPARELRAAGRSAARIEHVVAAAEQWSANSDRAGRL
jgi:fructuronate reductase